MNKNLSNEEYLTRIREIILSRFDNIRESDPINLDTNLQEDLPLESLDMIDFILGCETTFGVDLDMANAKNTHTIRDLIAFIQQAPEKSV